MFRRWALLACCVLAAVAVLPPGAATAAGGGGGGSGPTAAPRSDYGWPLAGWPRVARPFQPPASKYGPGHRGVDLAAAVGTPVLAAGDGVVVTAGELAGRGVVSVQHPDGLRTTYEPVIAQVHSGAAVVRGQPLGLLEPGHPDCAAAACLHWGVRRGEVYLDPLRLIGHWQVRLKTWEA